MPAFFRHFLLKNMLPLNFLDNRDFPDDVEDDEEEFTQPISTITALYALYNILSFLNNPPNEFAVDLKTLITIRSL